MCLTAVGCISERGGESLYVVVLSPQLMVFENSQQIATLERGPKHMPYSLRHIMFMDIF